jgi:Tol biopolymer transport system component
MADNNFLKTYQIKLAEGRYFSQEFATDTSAVVINETMAKTYGLTNPIGKSLTRIENDKAISQYKIIGIIKDFNYESLHQQVRPLIIHYRPGFIKEPQSKVVTARIRPENAKETIAYVQSVWKNFVPDENLYYDYVEDNLANLYNNERKIAEVTIKGQQSYIAYGYNANFNPPSWSSDGSLIAFGFDGYHYDDKYTRVALIRISGGIIREFAVRAWRMKNTELSNDGKKIAYITHEHSTKEANDVLDKQVHFTSIDDNSSVRSYRHSEGISWSPDGRYLAFVEKSITMGINRRVWILDTQKNQQIQLLTSRQEIEKVAWIKNDKIVILARTSKQDLSESAGAIGKIQSWLVTIKNLPA